MSYAAWSVVYGEQPSAAKWNILGTNDASFNDGSGIGAGVVLPNHLLAAASTLNTWVWDAWTPSFTNLTVGNGTLTAKYIKIGKTIIARVHFVFGNSSAVSGAVSFTLPVTSVSYPGIATVQPIGVAEYFSVSTIIEGWVAWASTTSANVYVKNSAGTYVVFAVLSSTVPYTWATAMEIHLNLCYEAA
jgi:hypothetical protein